MVYRNQKPYWSFWNKAILFITEYKFEMILGIEAYIFLNKRPKGANNRLAVVILIFYSNWRKICNQMLLWVWSCLPVDTMVSVQQLLVLIDISLWILKSMIWRDCNTTSFQHRVSKWQKLFSVFVFAVFTVYLFLKSFFYYILYTGKIYLHYKFVMVHIRKGQVLYYLVYLSFCITMYLVYLSFCITWSISVSYICENTVVDSGRSD